MSFVFNGLTLNITYSIPADLNLIESTPSSGEYQIKKLRLDSNKAIVVTYDETPES